MKQFDQIKAEMLLLIKLSRELGMLSESLLRFNNSRDKKLYDMSIVNKIQERINEKNEIYTELYFKYF